ncbi:MAG: flagellar basal-body MS-ring/collar protein FliF [Gammaproteobacteria bacterium]|nr:flagellar basal-body MS-ring/collar protein FliF [Gammaproteobacteria bacterium]MDH3535634.1 flagellar basal-body MS-ring/collar protein FliF [Gammaproteobacteria bacterium]
MADATINQQAQGGRDGQGMVAMAPRQINPIDAVAQSRAVRHFTKLIGLAAAIAIGMVVVLWSAEPNYAPLNSDMSGKDAAQAADILTSRDIDFKLDAASGTLLVEQSRMSEARLLLASQGLAGGASSGMEMLQQDQGLGTSQFIENARYNHALEAELVRSVESIRSVEKARVHLAIPEQSIFIRNRTRPSASVVVKLYPGRVLNAGQVEAIVQMIASSIPMMEGSGVKVVDQFGRLLTDDEDEGMAQTTRQFDYTRKLEDSFVDRIINLLQPIVGQGNVNAQVAAQIDFASVESTREAFDPERSVIRSEQISEEENRSLSQALGIPGALSNQPPAAGTIEPVAAAGAADAANELPGNQNRSATRNYEVDRIISHTSNPVGSIQRLSVAVVIDDKRVTADDGSVSKAPYSDAEIARFVNLVKETIGFDANRGDSVSVINASFLEVVEHEVEAVPAWRSLLDEAWVVNLIKQVLGAIGVVLVYFIFVRPLMRSLSFKNSDATGDASGGEVQTLGAPMAMQQGMAADGQYYRPGETGIPNLGDNPNSAAAMVRRKDATYEQKVDMARSMVMDDPARVANVMKQWVGEE